MLRSTSDAARREALFASALQRSDSPSAEMVNAAISATIDRLGATGCARHVAQEFGDHPELASERMRWVLDVTRDRDVTGDKPALASAG